MMDFTEYQTSEQYTHGFLLIMNSIFANAESVEMVAFASTYEDMLAWVDDQREAWEVTVDDHTYYMSFRAGSPLENYNPPLRMDLNQPGIFGDGVYEVEVKAERLSSDVYVVPAGYAKQKEAIQNGGEAN